MSASRARQLLLACEKAAPLDELTRSCGDLAGPSKVATVLRFHREACRREAQANAMRADGTLNKAVFLLRPADQLCPSQMGGLDLDYDYYYSVSRLDARPPRGLPRYCRLLWWS